MPGSTGDVRDMDALEWAFNCLMNRVSTFEVKRFLYFIRLAYVKLLPGLSFDFGSSRLDELSAVLVVNICYFCMDLTFSCML